MFTVMDIVQPDTVEEAYSILNKRKTNQVIGGSAFLRMGKKRIGTGIELSKLNLDYIKEYEDYVEIGSMTTFRTLETSSIIKNNFGRIIEDSVKNIIGVQFRNVVTVGATVFSKYGFSDLIVALLSLDTEVELYNIGRISLEEFLNRDYEKDLLIKIYIKKTNKNASYKSLRNAKSDYPILNVSVSKHMEQFKLCVGARPQKATIAKQASEFLSNNEINEINIDKAVEIASEELTFGSNMRASREYRKAMSKVLLKRAIMEVFNVVKININGKKKVLI
ncbi:FAD binding domain in molybdopterin dehydrogenase family protein [Clostridioides difficile DA00165]|nr:FAD binding domain in molybdopterin dehydrogenase family protein [Clostridioides difficile DA00165]